jgi:hypothetical protein
MKIFALGLLFALTVSCREQPSSASVRETVLSEGQSIEAMNKNGKIRISYVGPLKRRYEWDNSQRTVTLRPRQERFDGKLGLYEPADAWIFLPGKTRLVLDEAVRNFDTEEQIKAALKESSAYMDWIYTPDGLVVGFARTLSRKQINIDLFQFLVHGQRPSGLIGAKPEQIRVSQEK